MVTESPNIPLLSRRTIQTGVILSYVFELYGKFAYILESNDKTTPFGRVDFFQHHTGTFLVNGGD